MKKNLFNFCPGWGSNPRPSAQKSNTLARRHKSRLVPQGSISTTASGIKLPPMLPWTYPSLWDHLTVASPSCIQSCRHVFCLDCATSTFRMAHGCLECLPVQGCCKSRSLRVWVLCHWSFRTFLKVLINFLVHLLQLSRCNDLVQSEYPALVFDQLETGVRYRTHQLHCRHSWMLVHNLKFGDVQRACSQPHSYESAWN